MNNIFICTISILSFLFFFVCYISIHSAFLNLISYFIPASSSSLSCSEKQRNFFSRILKEGLTFHPILDAAEEYHTRLINLAIEVCMYVCTYVHTHTRIYTCMYVYLCIRLFSLLYLPIIIIHSLL